MKLVVLTIVKDGMPWITCHYPVLRALSHDWEWHVVEGTALPVKDTAWCNRIPAGLSSDGTTGYLDSLAFDRRVHIYRNPEWAGKVEMVNAPLRVMQEPCILLEADSDELWTHQQLEWMSMLFNCHEEWGGGQFWCRFFVGPDIVIVNRNTYANNPAQEWRRCWRWKPGMLFETHEPPVMSGTSGLILNHSQTELQGWVFDHMAYATRKQVEFKAKYYGSRHTKDGSAYANMLDGWDRLQKIGQEESKLKDYLPFASEDTVVQRLARA